MSYKKIYDIELRGLSIPSHFQLEPTVKKTVYTPVIEDHLLVSHLPEDYYLNPLCWANKTEVCFGRNNILYIHNRTMNRTRGFVNDSAITALASGAGTYAVAGLNGKIQYIDAEALRKIFFIQGSEAFTKIIYDGSHSFYAASKSDCSIAHIDLRAAQRAQPVLTFEEGIVGFTFQQDGVGSLAISNGTTIEIFDLSNLEHPRFIFKEHKSPSKALAFSPNNRYLMSGGGNDDQTLKIWDHQTGEIISDTVAYAQICNAFWVDEHNVFTTEGYPSGISCWTMNGRKLHKSDSSNDRHTNRVLYAAQNPEDPKKIVTACPDQNLCFWSIKDKSRARARETDFAEILDVPDSLLAGNRIR